MKEVKLYGVTIDSCLKDLREMAANDESGEVLKAVFYDEKKDRYPNYRCAVQKHIEEAAITDGCGNKRDYYATRSDCPYKQTERKKRIKKDPNQLMLNFEIINNEED